MVHSWCTRTQQTPVIGNKTPHTGAIRVVRKYIHFLLLSMISCCNLL